MYSSCRVAESFVDYNDLDLEQKEIRILVILGRLSSSDAYSVAVMYGPFLGSVISKSGYHKYVLWWWLNWCLGIAAHYALQHYGLALMSWINNSDATSNPRVPRLKTTVFAFFEAFNGGPMNRGICCGICLST